MIDKRLLKEMPDARSFIWKQVLMQWIAMLCNVVFVVVIAGLFTLLLQTTLTIEVIFYAILCVCLIVFVRIFVIKKAAYYSYRASCDVKLHLRHRMYEKLLEMEDDYHETLSSAELIQLSVEGVDQLETYFGRYLPQFFYSMLAPITLFVFIMWFDLQSAIVLLVCVPLIPVSIVLIQKFAKRLLSKYWASYATLGDSFLENLQGLTTLKIYQADEFKNEEMNKEAENFRNITMKVLTMQLNSVSVMDIIAYGGAAIGSIVAITNYLDGTLSFFGVVCIMLLASEFFIPLRVLGSYFHIAMNGIAASTKIFSLLDQDVKEVVYETWNTQPLSLKMNNVTFSYDGQRDVLHDVSIDMKEGNFIAIVGESGSGKSTIAKLIAGIHRGYTGDIFINEVQRNVLKNTEFYKNIVYVAHKPMIFKGTLKENLSIAGKDIQESKMLDALKKVQLYDFVMEQGGLSMQLKEAGTTLSGGQKQRLALARALLADREMYIFDEAASNIDSESEAIILESIQELSKTKTVVMITHRLSTLKTCDCIYVMKQGHKVEEGKHDELMKHQGIYAAMYTKQQTLENIYGGCTDERTK